MLNDYKPFYRGVQAHSIRIYPQSQAVSRWTCKPFDTYRIVSNGTLIFFFTIQNSQYREHRNENELCQIRCLSDGNKVPFIRAYNNCSDLESEIQFLSTMHPTTGLIALLLNLTILMALWMRLLDIVIIIKEGVYDSRERKYQSEQNT